MGPQTATPQPTQEVVTPAPVSVDASANVISASNAAETFIELTAAELKLDKEIAAFDVSMSGHDAVTGPALIKRKNKIDIDLRLEHTGQVEELEKAQKKEMEDMVFAMNKRHNEVKEALKDRQVAETDAKKAEYSELKWRFETDKGVLVKAKAAKMDPKTSLGKRKREDFGPEELCRVAEYLGAEVVKHRKTGEA
jgi:hypothetical protein